MYTTDTTSQKYKDYICHFNTAIEQTKSLGLKVDIIENNSKIPTRDDIIYASITAFSSKANMAHNCVHTGAVNDVLIRNGFNSGHITIGYLSYDNELEYHCSVETLKREIDSDSEEVVPMHVWITFPDGTILDPTLMATFEKEAGRLDQRDIKQLPFISPCDFPDLPIDIEYFPLLVGKDYLLLSNSIIEQSGPDFITGLQAAQHFYTNHLSQKNIGSLNDMKSFYKKDNPEGYRNIITGFRTQMNEFISKGLVQDRTHESDTLYYSTGHPDLKELHKTNF